MPLSTTVDIRNRNLQTSKAPLEGQAQGTSLFTSATSNQRVSKECKRDQGPVSRFQGGQTKSEVFCQRVSKRGRSPVSLSLLSSLKGLVRTKNKLYNFKLEFQVCFSSIDFWLYDSRILI